MLAPVRRQFPYQNTNEKPVYSNSIEIVSRYAYVLIYQTKIKRQLEPFVSNNNFKLGGQ